MADKKKNDDPKNEAQIAAEPTKKKRGRPRKTDADGTVTKPKTTRRRRNSWPSLMEKLVEEEVVDYNIKADFTETDAIRHKKFGVGFITKVLDINKIEVVFEEDKKVLAQNWE